MTKQTEEQKAAALARKESRRTEILTNALINPSHALIEAVEFGEKEEATELVKEILDMSGVIIDPNILNGTKGPALTIAAFKGRTEIVELLLTLKDIDINKRNKDGSTALILASQEDHEEIVEIFVLHPKIDMNILNNTGQSALHQAIYKGLPNIVELLLDRPILNDERKDIRINIKTTSEGYTPLMLAVINNDLLILQLLLNINGLNLNKHFTPANINEIDNKGNTVLMIAIQHAVDTTDSVQYKNYFDILKVLINIENLNINKKNSDTSALTLAVEKNRPDIVKLLIHVPNIYSIDALKKAVELGYVDIIHQLLYIEPTLTDEERLQSIGGLDRYTHSDDIKDQIRNLFVTIPISLEFLKAVIQHAEGFEEKNETKKREAMTVIERCMENKLLNINIINEYTGCGRTALMEASRIGDIDIVNVLLSKTGLDVNKQTTTYGDTALTYAAFKNHINVVKALRGKADPTVKTFLGDTGLIIAAKEGHEGVVAELLTYPDMNINEINNHQMTALMIAAYCGRDAIIDLLKHKADINKFTLFGNTALMYASMKGFTTIVDKLLDIPGIKYNNKTTYGDTSLSYAVENNHEDVVRSLLRKDDIEWNTCTLFGKTALMSAIEHQTLPIIQLLLDIPNNLEYIESTTTNGKTIKTFAKDTKNLEIVDLIEQTTRSIEKIQQIMKRISETPLISDEQLLEIPNTSHDDITKAREQYRVQVVATAVTVRNEQATAQRRSATPPSARRTPSGGSRYFKTLKQR